MIISGIIGLTPALILLWLTLRKYDYPFVEKTLFDDRKVFYLLAVGIVFGIIVAALYFSLSPGSTDALLLVLLIALGLAVFEEMFKFVVLNLKRLQLKFDTVFYGFSLGVGLSSTFVLYQVYLSIRVQSEMSALVWTILVIFSVAMSLIHGSTGALMGRGSAEGKPWRAFTEVITIRLFVIIILAPYLGNIGEDWLQVASLIGALVLSAFIYNYIVKDVIPNILPESIRRHKRLISRRIKKRKS